MARHLLLLGFLSLSPALGGVTQDATRNIPPPGKREVGKGLNWYSPEREIALGKARAQQMEAQSRLLDDPVVYEYVNRVAQNLVRSSEAQLPLTVKVIASDEAEATVLPGGFFYVNTGLLLEADEEAEMAAAMAHHIAHVAARHATRLATRAELTGEMSAYVASMHGSSGERVRGGGLPFPSVLAAFSRLYEREADELGLQCLYKAGYDPHAFVSFSERVNATEKDKKRPGTLIFSPPTHSQTPDRIAATRQRIVTDLPAVTEHIVTTSEFQSIQARLRAIRTGTPLSDLAKAPESKLDYAVYRTGTGYRIIGRIRQDQEELRLPVDLRIETDGELEVRRLDVLGRVADFTVETSGRPRRITVRGSVC